MNRVVVVGSSGSGKSTLAAAVAAHLAAPHIELDALHHQPDWEPLPDDEFLVELSRRTARPSWVVDGNYPRFADLLWSAADTVIWLDLPRPLVMRRVAVRTIVRLATRKELWNGNRERLGQFLSPDPSKNLLLWTWTMHPVYRTRYSHRISDPRWKPLSVHRLRSPRQVAAFRREKLTSSE